MKTSTARSRIVDTQVERDIETVIKLDTLLKQALRGDRCAVGAIAIAFGSILLEQAEAALGPDYAHEASDVLQDFFVCLVEGDVRIHPARGRAISWMCGVIRAIARKYRGDRDWEWDIDSDVDDEL